MWKTNHEIVIHLKTFTNNNNINNIEYTSIFFLVKTKSYITNNQEQHILEIHQH